MRLQSVIMCLFSNPSRKVMVLVKYEQTSFSVHIMEENTIEWKENDSESSTITVQLNEFLAYQWTYLCCESSS